MQDGFIFSWPEYNPKSDDTTVHSLKTSIDSLPIALTRGDGYIATKVLYDGSRIFFEKGAGGGQTVDGQRQSTLRMYHDRSGRYHFIGGGEHRYYR